MEMTTKGVWQGVIMSLKSLSGNLRLRIKCFVSGRGLVEGVKGNVRLCIHLPYVIERKVMERVVSSFW